MFKRDFTALRLVGMIALVLSAALIAFICVSPKLFIEELYSGIRPSLESAADHALEGAYSSARSDIETVCRDLKSKRGMLMLFFDHNDVDDLIGSAETALELTETEDAAQLIAELHGVQRAFEYLIQINGVSIYSVF